MKPRTDVGACEVITRRAPLRAATGRSQAPAPLQSDPAEPRLPVEPRQAPACDAVGRARPQGCAEAKPEHPAGGPVATSPRASPTTCPVGTPSSLDNSDITRPHQDKSALQIAYVVALEEPTRAHRTAKAKRLRHLGRRRRARIRNAGGSESEVVERSKWYENRARGEETRIALVLECGAEVLIIGCQACGAKHERALRCRARRYCVHCRGVIAAEMRARFLAARADVVRDAVAAGLLNPYRKGGRYGDKFLTLTTPHLPFDTIASRIERLFAAWSKFLRWLNAYFDERTIRRVEWLRVVEWTPGESDDAGHPHLHLWLFAPYLDHSMLQDFWRLALLTTGCPPEACAAPIIDIRAMPDPNSGAQELIKYLTKDITANGDKLAPALYAQVIEALDCHRQSQGSKGFMGRADKEPRRCNECDSPLPKRVQRKPRTSPEQNEA